jgi:hypothetical protein
MTLYEQFLVELLARLSAIPGLGSGGAKRGDSFALEREQRPGIRLDDGVLQTVIASNDCDMTCTSACSILISANTEAERDALINAAYRACDHQAAPWPMKIIRATPTEVRYTHGGADVTCFAATIPIAVGPYTVRKYQLDTPH